MQNDTPCIQGNTINPRELFTVLKKCKKLIVIVTVVIILVLAYTVSAKLIYRGSVPLEVGEVVIEQTYKEKESLLSIIELDNANNLKNIIESKCNVLATLPKKANTIINYTATGADKISIILFKT